MNPGVDLYLAEGCGRCSLHATPNCKVHLWTEELKLLRSIALDCGLTEEVKWSVPVYTYKNKNVLLIGAFKQYCSLAFFKGSLLKDDHSILDKQGENSQASRIFKCTNTERILQLEPILKTYIYEAIEIEKSWQKVAAKKTEEYPVPAELQEKLDSDPVFKEAYDALTPGRKRSYLLHFSSAKQSATRYARIEKCMPAIFEGKGFNEY